MKFHRDTPEECLERAQLFIDCANEAWQQFTRGLRNMDNAPELIHEIDAYLAAAAALLRYRNDVGRLRESPSALFIKMADLYVMTDDEVAEKTVHGLS